MPPPEPEVEDGLALAELGDGRRVAAAEAGQGRRIGQVRPVGRARRGPPEDLGAVGGRAARASEASALGLQHGSASARRFEASASLGGALGSRTSRAAAA